MGLRGFGIVLREFYKRRHGRCSTWSMQLDNRTDTTYEPFHEISLLVAHAQMPHIIAQADVSSEAIGIKFGLSLHLHPYFMYASNDIQRGLA